MRQDVPYGKTQDTLGT